MSIYRTSVSPSVQTIAHRGARAFAPENSIEAFAKAHKLGADAVELDVQFTSDGKIIVLHDESLERCANVRERFPGRSTYAVRDFTLAEVQSLDAGSWFVRAMALPASERPEPYMKLLTADEARSWIKPRDVDRFTSGDVRHPTLRQVLVAVRASRGREMEVHIELKGFAEVHPKLPAAVVKLVRSLGMRERVVISSFDHLALAKVRSLDASIRSGVLVMQPMVDLAGYCRDRVRATSCHPGCYGDYDVLGLDAATRGELPGRPREVIQPLRCAGLGVNVWTENDRERMQTLVDAGATGIMSDYPNRVRAG